MPISSNCGFIFVVLWVSQSGWVSCRSARERERERERESHTNLDTDTNTNTQTHKHTNTRSACAMRKTNVTKPVCPSKSNPCEPTAHTRTHLIRQPSSNTIHHLHNNNIIINIIMDKSRHPIHCHPMLCCSPSEGGRKPVLCVPVRFTKTDSFFFFFFFSLSIFFLCGQHTVYISSSTVNRENTTPLPVGTDVHVLSSSHTHTTRTTTHRAETFLDTLQWLAEQSVRAAQSISEHTQCGEQWRTVGNTLGERTSHKKNVARTNTNRTTTSTTAKQQQRHGRKAKFCLLCL